MGILRRLSYTIPKKLLRPVYYTLVHSHLQYLTALWFPSGSRIKKIERLQNKAIKNLYLLSYRYSTELLYKNFKFMSVEQIYKYQICAFIHQVVGGSKFSNMTFTYRHEVHNFNTRFKNNLSTPQTDSRMASASVYVKGVSIYNRLPEYVRQLNSSRFKIFIKNNIRTF